MSVGVTEHCYKIRLRIYRTNCSTLGYDSELCLVIGFLFLVHLYTCRLPDSFEHLVCATLFLFRTSFGVCTQKEVTLSELKNILLCNKRIIFLQ